MRFGLTITNQISFFFPIRVSLEISFADMGLLTNLWIMLFDYWPQHSLSTKTTKSSVINAIIFLLKPICFPWIWGQIYLDENGFLSPIDVWVCNKNKLKETFFKNLILKLLRKWWVTSLHFMNFYVRINSILLGSRTPNTH